MIPEPDFSKMTDEEVEFYYFQVHDTDKNSRLDGLEILQAMFHTGQHAYDENGNAVTTETNSEDFEFYVGKKLQFGLYFKIIHRKLTSSTV